MMSREQLSTTELLLSLDSLELQEAERVRAAVTQQLSSDRGGAVLSSLVEHFVDSSSAQALQLLSSIREPHHKPLLEKLNEVLSRPASRLAAVTLLGHLIRKQPPWVHHVSQAAVLPTLLRCLKTDGDVIVLITGVLVLITLLPMIPQAGKQHIYDFFDVFGRLASWSLKNPGHVPSVQLVHLQASVYSLFHRLYGMFPCNFISYLRLHYSMKENLDTFQEVVRPMLDQVRVHPELVTGTQDDELDPSRWRCYEVHDIIIECSRVSLDPRESSCENSTFCVSSSPPPHLSSPLPQLHQLTDNSLHKQADDVTWSPSSQCGLSTPPPECTAVSSALPLSRTTSIPDGGRSLSSISPLPGDDQDGVPPPDSNQVKHPPITEKPESACQPVTESKHPVRDDVINSSSEDVKAGFWPPSPSWSSQSVRTSTPARDTWSSGSVTFCCAPTRLEDGGSAPTRLEDGGSAAPYDPLFELALPCAATLFMGKKGAPEKGGGRVEEQTSISPLELLDQLIVYGHDAHEQLSDRSSVGSKSLDLSQVGGKHQSMKLKGSAQEEEELQALRSQLLLLHSQLQYERFKRQQHAIRNRRLIRRAISATALEEQSNAMRAQLSVQEEEIRCLKMSLEKEQRRYTELQRDTHTHTTQLNTHIQQLLLHQQDMQRDNQQLQSELQECQRRLKEIEADLQNTNNKAYNTEHQLTQLSLKLSSSEQLQQQIFILNQQLLLLRETNRILMEHLEGRDGPRNPEASMLKCIVGKEYQRLKDSEAQQRQKLEAANHRAAELENQLVKKDQLVLDLKKLLDDTKDQSRAELAACETRCASLRRIAQTLQTEMLQLYSQIQLDTPPSSQLDTPPHSITWAAGSRPGGGGGSVALPVSRPSSILNGSVEHLSTSPLLLPSSPIDSPLVVGSFLEQRARQLFRPTDQGQKEEAELQEEEQDEQDEQEEAEPQVEPEKAEPQDEQEGTWSSIVAGSPQMEAARGTPAASGHHRRRELSIMDYNETLPEL